MNESWREAMGEWTKEQEKQFLEDCKHWGLSKEETESTRRSIERYHRRELSGIVDRFLRGLTNG